MRTALARLAVERMFGLHHVGRDAAHVIGGGLTRREKPSSGADAARQPEAGMRNANRQQRFDGGAGRGSLAFIVNLFVVRHRAEHDLNWAWCYCR
jgi:hypothetical protein